MPDDTVVSYAYNCLVIKEIGILKLGMRVGMSCSVQYVQSQAYKLSCITALELCINNEVC